MEQGGTSAALKGILFAVVAAGAMALGGALTLTFADGGDKPATAVTTPNAAPEQTSVAISTVSAPGLPGVVDRVSNSVVAIRTVVGAGIRQGSGTGTGVVVDRAGHIVTNYHVIDGARQITVEFKDGTVVAATVVREDETGDLAVLRVEVSANLLQPATLADSSLVKPGDAVFAIGNPFGLEFSVTAGVVSGLDRSSPAGIPNRLRGLIQTDAAVNPGNSGGPLFNLAGEVIGINSSIENPSGASVFVGVGFAIASNTVRSFAADLLAP